MSWRNWPLIARRRATATTSPAGREAESLRAEIESLPPTQALVSLHVVDLTAARAGVVRRELIGRAVAAAAPARVQAAGGVRSTTDARALVDAGADARCCWDRGVLVAELPRRPRGRARREARRRDRRTRWLCRRRRLGNAYGPPLPVADAVARAVDAGASRLLCTAIERDGTLGGPSLGLLERCARCRAFRCSQPGTPLRRRSRRDRGGRCEGAIVGRALLDETMPLSVLAASREGRSTVSTLNLQ